MRHLKLESLARLVDENPTKDEKEHLHSCPECTEELRALREQTQILAARADLRPAAVEWEALESRLAAEGLIRTGHRDHEGGRRFGPFRITSRRSMTIRAAAAIVLFLGGTTLGAAMEWGMGGEPDPVFGGGVRVAKSRTVEAAAEAVRMKRAELHDALLVHRQLIRESGEAFEEPDPTSRLSSLNELVAATQARVRQDPTDPFLNGMLVSTLAERQATLHQISTAESDNWY